MTALGSPNAHILPTSALALTLLLSLPVLFALLRATSKIRAIARAVPPLRAGEPSACRVCGAPLQGTRGVVRCPFCASDNVVDASVLARAGEGHATDARVLEDEVRLQATSIGEARGLGVPMLASLALLPVPFIVVWFGAPLAEAVTVSPTEEKIVFIAESGPLRRSKDTPHALCLHRSDVCAGSSTCVSHPPVEPAWLIGKETREGMRIVAVGNNTMRGLEVTLDDDQRSNLFEVCLRAHESDAWRKLAEEDARREREEAEADRRTEENLRKFFGDAGLPKIELQPVPLPSLRVFP